MIKNLPQRPHAKDTQELLTLLDSNIEVGLELSAVQKRRQLFGENRLEQERKRPILYIFLEQFLDPVILVLIIAATLGFIFGEIAEGIAIVAVILITAGIGFVMEWQARRSMEALQKMAETKATVVRAGTEKVIESSQIVPGDILHLNCGDVVPADARVLQHESLAVKESALTGESAQVEKNIAPLAEDAELAERSNMVFTGTLITRGTATALVTAIGSQTELGVISRLTQSEEEESTPIEKKLKTLSKKLIWLTLILATLIALVGFIQGRELRQMIETAFALAVAAIPEGLPIVATIALARGMLRLARDRAIIKKLSSVETLGNVGMICTDKTGTLTENQMAVQSILFSEEQLEIPEAATQAFWAKHQQKEAFILLLETGVLCNNVKPTSDGQPPTGDPVEIALVDLVETAGLSVNEIRKRYPEQEEYPFDTEIKMMATLNKEGEAYRISAKGALENILECCETVYTPAGIVPLSDTSSWISAADRLADQGLRTLAFAYQKTNDRPPKEQFFEQLTFLGLMGFLDPPRLDVKPVIDTCHEAGIRVVMVTGDYPKTARNIAMVLDILPDDDTGEGVISGRELAQLDLSNPAVEKRLLDARVFARVTPSQKLKLVSLFQQHQFVVGMTGDGVNDAPALKKADIGIAMGIRGTEAAKEVADVILRDDQFSSIEHAIRQGRIIFENIRKFVVYLLSSNLAEIISVAAASLSNLPLPLLPMQILYLNLVTDVFPALSLAMGEGEKDSMKRPPRPADEPIMPRSLWVATLVYGLGITIGVLGISLFAHFYLNVEAAVVNNMAFYTLVLAQLFNVFNLPKRSSSFFNNEITRNPWVWGAIVLCILLTAMGYALAPLRQVLSLVPISAEQLMWVVVFSGFSLLMSQLMKWVGRIEV